VLFLFYLLVYFIQLFEQSQRVLVAAHQTGLVDRPKGREELLQLLLTALLSVESLEFYAEFLRLHIGIIFLLLAGCAPPVHSPN
jgi:hypothetical protein